MNDKYAWFKKVVIKLSLFINKIKNCKMIKAIGANKKEYWYDENGVIHTKLIIRRMK